MRLAAVCAIVGGLVLVSSAAAQPGERGTERPREERRQVERREGARDAVRERWEKLPPEVKRAIIVRGLQEHRRRQMQGPGGGIGREGFSPQRRMMIERMHRQMHQRMHQGGGPGMRSRPGMQGAPPMDRRGPAFGQPRFQGGPPGAMLHRQQGPQQGGMGRGLGPTGRQMGPGMQGRGFELRGQRGQIGRGGFEGRRLEIERRELRRQGAPPMGPPRGRPE